MKINNLREYVFKFIDELSLSADEDYGHTYKSFIRGAIGDFLDNETKETAFGVYRTFFDIYQTIDSNTNTSFIDLLDTLRRYEENAATLLDKQRDHYIHSVNVFILGLSIFSQNSRYQEIFNSYYLKDMSPMWLHKARNEEFFFRWGIASLFHDIGYPAEITVNQVSKFLKLITSVDTATSPVVHIGMDDFKKIDSIPVIADKNAFTKEFIECYPIAKTLNLYEPTDLLAFNLYQSFNVPLDTIVKALDDYIYELAKLGFVDHGFYSSLIVLKWYGDSIQRANQNPGSFYYQILSCASAILLHNYYKNYFTEGKKFNHGPMHTAEHPIAWLLILADELQEWNRIAYGELDKKKVLAADATLFIDEHRMSITYIAAKGSMIAGFGENKEHDLRRLLHLDDLFTQGFSIGCESMDELGDLSAIALRKETLLPRPLLENMEKMAIAIHDFYNKEQLARNPDQKLEYPKFADLPSTLKYSNLRQARDLVKKLELIGCEMQPIGSEGQVVDTLPTEDVEYLAKYEHDLWMKERIESGWTYGKIKDVEKKKSPYLIPYEDLSEEIKQLDRDTIDNIPHLVRLIGMAVYRSKDIKR